MSDSIDWTQLHKLLDAAAQGEAEPSSVLTEMAAALCGSPTTGGAARVDLARASRCGHPEVIYGPGKPPEVLLEICRRLHTASQDVLATRVSQEQGEFVSLQQSEVHWNRTARTLRWMQPQSLSSDSDSSRSTQSVAVVTAGTSDLPIAEEAAETLRWMRQPCEIIADVGVAGPTRLLSVLPQLRDAPAIIVVAGMEGALPSVVGGWVRCPVIAVPTSVGYGSSFNGLTPLLGMLNSCAANVTVVNIDAGFKAGYIAGLIAER